jgi:hypothetical protein
MMDERSFPDIALLIQRVEAAAADQLDIPAAVARLVKAGVDGSADPYLLIGALIEGVAHTLASVPVQVQAPTAKAATRLFLGRMAARGLLE